MSSATGWLSGALTAILAVAAIPVFGAGVPAGDPNGGRALEADVVDGYASTHIVVKFKPASFKSDAAKKGMARGSAHLNRRPVPSRALQEVYDRWGAARVRPFYPYEFANPELAAELGLDRTYIIELPQGTNVPAMAAQLRAFTDEVQTASHDGIGSVALMPNDPWFAASQWNMDNTWGYEPESDINAPEAWEIHTGNPGTVTLAMIDSGLGPHIEFTGRVVPGINTVDPGEPDLTIDECMNVVDGHGTHVAGIAAATGNNGIGVAGVSWGVNLMPVRVVGGAGGCYGEESHCAQGIIWAADNGADICNISLQFNGTEALEDAVDYAYGMGVLLIAAAGNHTSTQPSAVRAPAKYANCMAVSATTDRNLLAIFSNYGPELDVCAPGDNVWSTILGDSYDYCDGTSMATPHASGVAALVKSYVPGLTNDEIRGILNSTADYLDPPIAFGNGQVNAHAALLAADAMSIRAVSSTPPDGAVDARQPSAPSGADPADSWNSFDLTFNGSVFELTEADFSVETEGAGSTPGILTFALSGEETVTIVLDSAIPLGAWTTVQHDYTGTGSRVGYLPGDVNGDGTSDVSDIAALVDALDGVTELGTHQTDINRDEEIGPADMLRLIDLLNGAGVYEPYLGAALP